MLNRLIRTTLMLSFVGSTLFGATAVRFHVIDGDVGEKYNKLVLGSAIENATGFATTDPHERIDEAYENRYGNLKHPDYDKAWKTNLDNLGFFPMESDRALHDILLTSPQVAGFQPFNLLIYKKSSENRTYIGHIDPNTMLDITGVTNAKDRAAYVKMFVPLDAWVGKTFGGKIKTTPLVQKLPAKPMMTFEFRVDRSKGIAQFTEAFQKKLEAAFEKKHYIIAGYKDFKESYEEDMEIPFSRYDQFFVYGLCHFTFSYNLFNKGRPDAGVFAPCSMYFYIKAGSNKMVVGMPRLATWVRVMNIQDPTKIEWTKKVDDEILNIMKSLGGKEI